MIDYSFELNIDKIDNHRTREYFKDVLSSLNIASYRGAIVLLHSVVVCDLIYKLTELSEVFADETATKILSEIKIKQQEHPNSSRWEAELIEDVYEKTQLLDFPDYTTIKNLQQLRHICAHPIFVNENQLYNPNKETARSYIRNIYEGLLTRKTLKSKEIFQDLLLDLEKRKTELTYESELAPYLESKYFQYLRPHLKERFFKNLWKFVFKLDNTKANENRFINFRCLSILHRKNKELLNLLFVNEKSYFNEINEDLSFDFLIMFLSENPELYVHINEDKKVIIQSKIKDNIELQILFSIVEENMDDVIKNSKQMLWENPKEFGSNYQYFQNLGRLLQLANEKGKRELSVNTSIDFYVTSGSYNDCDYSFSYLVKPLLTFFDKADYLKLLEGIESNNQSYHRRRAADDHKFLMKKLQLRFSDIDMSKFPNFTSSMQ
jgi:hypothetical protein